MKVSRVGEGARLWVGDRSSGAITLDFADLLRCGRVLSKAYCRYD